MQSTDLKAKEKFHQISIAYTKLISHHQGEGESDDDVININDDIHEMRAFMRMFMDLVGIFNEERGGPGEDRGGAMSFGMVFGGGGDGHPGGDDNDWDTNSSTEDEEDSDEEDSDDEHKSSPKVAQAKVSGNPKPISTDSSHKANSTSSLRTAAIQPIVSNDNSWEPMVRNYFPMNLKDDVKKEKISQQLRDTDSDEEDEGETYFFVCSDILSYLLIMKCIFFKMTQWVI